MRSLRYHRWGAAPSVDEVPVAVRRPGEVLVALQAAALSHLDLTVASGNFAMHPELPYVGGVEGSGVVIEADELPTGTQVLVRGGGVGLLRDGCWQEQTSVPVKAVTVLPVELPPVLAATFFVPTTTAYLALHDVAELGPNEQVVVTGAAGAVGSVVVQLALAAGAEVVAVVGRPENAGRVPEGARVLVAGRDHEALDRLGAERDATLLVDTVGGDALVSRCRWVRPGGRAVLVGYLAGTKLTIDLPGWLLDDVSLLPVNMIRREARAKAVAPELASQLAAGTLSVGVESFALDGAVDGLVRLAAGDVVGRAAISFLPATGC